MVDGLLDDEIWGQAPSAEHFWIAQWNKPPSDDTMVQVLFDDSVLYIAFTCYDTKPDGIQALQIRRDGSPGVDDHVILELDPYHNHRSISRFMVTARGTQSDAMAGGRARKIEWKGDWRAAAARTELGWTAEMAIPLDILDFVPGTRTFGINFVRYQNRTKEWSSWANVTPRALPEEAGHLAGLQLTRTPPASRLTVMQYASGALNAAGRSGDLQSRVGNTGADLRYEWRGAVTSVVSARPDFSDSDGDVLGLGFSYNEKFLSDKRPFFQEGGGFFGDASVLHSGRIPNFDIGGKSFGRMGSYQMGALAVADTTTGRTDYAGRVVRELGDTFNSSVTFVGTNRAGFANRVVQLQSGGRVGSHVQVNGNFANTATSGAVGDGSRYRGSLEYQTNHWFTGAWADHTAATYLPANGFIAADVLGTRGRGMYTSYNHAFGGRWLRRADASLSYERRDTKTGELQRKNYSFYAGGETASNISFNAGVTAGPYRPRTDALDVWSDTFNDDVFYSASAYYASPTGRFGYGTAYAWGFLGNENYGNLAPSFWVVPSAHLSLNYSFERADYYELQHQHVLAGTWLLNSQQSLSARWVQHDDPFFRVSYRRVVNRGVDVFGVYSSDPYRDDTVALKLVWTLLPFSLK